MSSAFQNSALRSAPRIAQPSLDVDATIIDTLIIDTLRALAPSIDPLVACCKEGTASTRAIDASRQFMGVQQAAADARLALEKRFPELVGNAGVGSAGTSELHHHAHEWAQKVHHTLAALEARIREGYKSNENPVAVRDAVIVGESEHSPSALRVLGVIIASNKVSNFDVSDPRNARALGIRSNLSELPLPKLPLPKKVA